MKAFETSLGWVLNMCKHFFFLGGRGGGLELLGLDNLWDFDKINVVNYFKNTTLHSVCQLIYLGEILLYALMIQLCDHNIKKGPSRKALGIEYLTCNPVT